MSAPNALRPVLMRELHSALINRYFQCFSAVALGCGVAGAMLSESADGAVAFAIQIALYFVPLFALLLGVSSARMESEEWPILFSQPISRKLLVGGKFAAGWGAFAIVVALLFIPALGSGAAPGSIVRLYGCGLGLSAIFISLGLAVGIYSGDRVQALVIGIGVWLILFLGFDLAAMLLAHWTMFQKMPDFWVALLMLNPVDAFRVQGLFALQQIPAETASKTPLAALWLQYPAAWFGILSICWSFLLLAAGIRRLEKMEF